MITQISPRAKRNLTALLISGAAAGFLNGLLGAGGGIILLYALSAQNPDKSEAGVRDNFASTIACVLPMTALSAILYATAGNLSGEGMGVNVIPAALGGFFGAFLLDKISTGLLKKIFAVLVLYAGISMLVR